MNYLTTPYLELKDENSLPYGTSFIDPYDGMQFTVKHGDTLPGLIKRIQAYRREKQYPFLGEEELRALVVSFLAETCPVEKAAQYFVQKASILPEFSQVLNFAQVVARQTVANVQVPTTKRQARAKKCLTCPLHRASRPQPKAVTAISKALFSTANYEEEKHLGTCGMCGCGLQAKVKFHLPAIIASLDPQQIDIGLRTLGSKFFDTCWIMSEGIEHADLRKILQVKMDRGTQLGSSLLQAKLIEKNRSAKSNGST